MEKVTKYEKLKIIRCKLENWNNDELHYLEREKLEKEKRKLKIELEKEENIEREKRIKFNEKLKSFDEIKKEKK